MKYAERIEMGSVVLTSSSNENLKWHGIPAAEEVFVLVEIYEGAVGVSVYTYRYLNLAGGLPSLQAFTTEENEALWDSLDSYDYPVHCVLKEFYTSTGPVVVQWDSLDRIEDKSSLEKSFREDKPCMNILKDALMRVRVRGGEPMFVYPEEKDTVSIC